MTTQEQRNRLSALRAKHRTKGQAVTSTGLRVDWALLAQEVIQVRAQLADAERQVVLTARAVGVSWDRISVALGGVPSGEQLRRRYT